MNIKIIAVLSVLVMVAVGWYYWNQDDQKPKVELAKPDISLEVTDIKAVQTNPQTGEIEYTLTAKSLVQNSATGKDELKDVVMDWNPNTGMTYTMTASTATFDQNTGEFVFGEGFEMVRHAIDDKPALVLKGSLLTGNTKTKLIASSSPLKVTQGESIFEAQSVQGDLNTGMYEFGRISTEFTAPKRTDKPLF